MATLSETQSRREALQKFYKLLGHKNLGVTEQRIFDGKSMVAYTDNEQDFVRLSLQKDGTASGIYVGVQPRPPHLFDRAPNQWTRAIGGPDGNCSRDNDIEFITTLFFDIDVMSEGRNEGHPASEIELHNTLKVAKCLANQSELKGYATICCSGNGHYVMAPLVPIVVYNKEVALQFTKFCQDLANRIPKTLLNAVRIDSVYNLSRVMRVIGTINQKAKPVSGRPHRRACFINGPNLNRSEELNHRILNTETRSLVSISSTINGSVRCNLKRLQDCEFIKWCTKKPQLVSQPMWFGLITNLCYLMGGIELIHDISKLDKFRYDYANTQKLIDRVVEMKYKPVNCQNLIKMAPVSSAHMCFSCQHIKNCPAKAPMYMAVHHTVY